MRKTYREIIEFINASAQYLRTHPAKNKLEYALTKVSKKAMKLYEQYNERVEDLRIDNCAVDSQGVILRDERQSYKFTKEGLKAFSKAQRALSEESAEIEPFIAGETPPLGELERELFDGYVLGPDTKIAEPAPPKAEPDPAVTPA